MKKEWKAMQPGPNEREGAKNLTRLAACFWTLHSTVVTRRGFGFGRYSKQTPRDRRQAPLIVERKILLRQIDGGKIVVEGIYRVIGVIICSVCLKSNRPWRGHAKNPRK